MRTFHWDENQTKTKTPHSFTFLLPKTEGPGPCGGRGESHSSSHRLFSCAESDRAVTPSGSQSQPSPWQETAAPHSGTFPGCKDLSEKAKLDGTAAPVLHCFIIRAKSASNARLQTSCNLHIFQKIKYQEEKHLLGSLAFFKSCLVTSYFSSCIGIENLSNFKSLIHLVMYYKQ